ncbi:hypothetical protein L6R53_06915 [Myxococcota bacterium]|nr:hypothetical protein [Myxococcota bacterium]
MSSSSSSSPGSSLGRIRHLARKVRGRLGGRPATIGDHFGPDNDVAFAVLEEEGDAAFQRVGASLVGAWEVAITDLARALEPRLESAAKYKLTERLSDSLVPTQQPLQDAKHQFASAVKKGAQAGLKSGRLADAVAPAVAMVDGLAVPVGKGWQKSTDYMQPIWDALPDGAAAKADFGALGPRLQALLEEQARVYRQALEDLPRQPDLERAIRDAMEAWYAKVSVGIELIVYDGRTVLVRAAERLPTRPA